MRTVVSRGVYRRRRAVAFLLVACPAVMLASHLAGPHLGGGTSLGATPAPTSEATAGPPAEPATPADCAVDTCIALTFDDGPGPFTDQLLDTLRDRDVHATFFVLGAAVERHPDALRRAAAEGHEIGNHTWSHRDLTTLPAAEVQHEVGSTADLVQQVTGTRPTLVRPPSGARNTVVDPLVGGPEILWDVDPRDWATTDGAAVLQDVLDGVEPGSIVLLHDIKQSTVAVVPTIIDELRQRGYRLVTVSQLLAGKDLQPGAEYSHRSPE